MSKFLGKIETFWEEEITENVWYFDTALKYINLIISTILWGCLAVVLAHFYASWVINLPSWVMNLPSWVKHLGVAALVGVAVLLFLVLFLSLLILVSLGVSKTGLFRSLSTPPAVPTHGAFELKSYQTNLSAGEILARILHIETFWGKEIRPNLYFDTALKYINLIISTILLGGLAVVLAHFHAAWWVIILGVVFLFLPLLILVSLGVSKAGLFRSLSTPPAVPTHGAFELKSYQTNLSAGEILARIFHIETFWGKKIRPNLYFDTKLKYINLTISAILLGGLVVVLAHFYPSWVIILAVVILLPLPLLKLVSSVVSKTGLFGRYSTPPAVPGIGAFELKRSYQTNFGAGEILAGILHIVVIAGFLLYSQASPKLPEPKKNPVRTKTVAELTRPPIQGLEPPPSLTPTQGQVPPPEPSTEGKPEPVPESDKTTPTQKQLGRLADWAAADIKNISGETPISDMKIDLESYSPQTAKPGGTINLQVSLRNKGHVTMHEVSGSLTTTTPSTKITEKKNHFGSIEPGVTVSNSQAPFVISFDNNISPGQVYFTLTLRGGNPNYSNELQVGPISIIAEIVSTNPSLSDTIESLARQELIPRIRWLRGGMNVVNEYSIGPYITFKPDCIAIEYDGHIYQFRYDYGKFAGEIPKKLPLDQLVQLPDIELRLRKALLLFFLSEFRRQFPDAERTLRNNP